jgi:hypothetical protein
MLKLLFGRGIIVLLPFALYGFWRLMGRWRGAPPRPTPWWWLIGASAVIAAIMVLSTGPFHSSGTGQYVPAQTRPDGSVAPGYYEDREHTKR